ncbi:MAG: class I fructose-bisphosphate aldolase, partial [Alphaproteobacteria bacterium]
MSDFTGKCHSRSPAHGIHQLRNHGRRRRATKPWTSNLGYGRALQDPALKAWRGRDENLTIGARAIALRARATAPRASEPVRKRSRATLFDADAVSYRVRPKHRKQ